MSTESDSDSSSQTLNSRFVFEAGGWTINYSDVRQTSSDYTVSKDNYKIVVNETDLDDEAYRVALLEDSSYGMREIGEGFYVDGRDEAYEKTGEAAQLLDCLDHLDHFGLADI